MTSTDTRDGVGAANDDDVSAFASAVRKHLDDLPPDEIDDLVDGLEADLIERREDSGEPLGDPVAYADELRAAAGLPPRDTRSGSEWFGGARRLRADVSAWVRRQREKPAFAAALDFLISLRPVWWVLRGWAACRLTVMMNSSGELPDTATGWGVLIAFVVVSIQWGRGRWMPWSWLLAVKRFVSVVVVLVLPWVVGAAGGALATGTSYSYVTEEVAPQELSANGTQVSNVFAYDCAGNPLSGVQLFDQDGTPLRVGGGGSDDWVIAYQEDGTEIALVPDPTANPGAGWNVFPLYHSRFGDGDVVPDPDTFTSPTPPFGVVPPLAAADGSCPVDVEDGSGSESEDQADDGSPVPTPTGNAPAEGEATEGAPTEGGN